MQPTLYPKPSPSYFKQLEFADYLGIAIKINIGKLQIHRPIEDLSKELQYTNIQILPIITQNTELYSTLSLLHKKIEKILWQDNY